MVATIESKDFASSLGGGHGVSTLDIHVARLSVLDGGRGGRG